jgi:hypothetical protein
MYAYKSCKYTSWKRIMLRISRALLQLSSEYQIYCAMFWPFILYSLFNHVVECQCLLKGKCVEQIIRNLFAWRKRVYLNVPKSTFSDSGYQSSTLKQKWLLWELCGLVAKLYGNTRMSWESEVLWSNCDIIAKLLYQSAMFLCKRNMFNSL